MEPQAEGLTAPLLFCLIIASDGFEKLRKSRESSAESPENRIEAYKARLVVIEHFEKSLCLLRRECAHTHRNEVTNGYLRCHSREHFAVAVSVGAHTGHYLFDKSAKLAAPLGVACVVKAAVKVNLLVLIYFGIRKLTVNSSEIITSDICNIIVVIRSCLSVIRNACGNGGFNGHGSRKLDIAARRTYEYVKFTGFNHPVAELYVVERERSLGKLDGYLFLFACFKEYLLNSAKLFLRTENGGFLIGNVNLGDFRAVYTACILYLERNRNRIGILHFVL